MIVRKAAWALRALALKPFFGKIGSLSYIGPTTFLYSPRRMYLGKRVRIFPGARLECHGANGRLIIENDVSAGQNLHIVAANELRIGSNTVISGNVLINDLDYDYQSLADSFLRNPRRIHLTRVGKSCFIGYGAVLQAGTILGDYCIVGANSVIRGEYPPYSVIAGNPGRVIRTIAPVT